MELQEVNNKSGIRAFHRVPRLIYKDDDVWVCPLESDIESIFNPDKNRFFSNGEAIRWVLRDGNGKLIGRVAAFINRDKAYNYEQPTGGMGFFECIDSKDAAFKLFDTCRDWLQSRGMEAMDGPINFGENDNWWGLLVEGFTPPAYGMQYHRPYYRSLFEDYGFSPFFEQTTRHLSTHKPYTDRFWKIAEWSIRKEGVSFKHFTFRDQEKFIHDFKEIYDEAWKFHEGFTAIDINNLRNTLRKSKPLIVEEFIWFAYHENQPIGLLVMFPDFNQAIKKLRGKLNLLNKLRLLLFLRSRKFSRARVVIFGIIPKFQRSGIESGIFWNLEKVVRQYPEYDEIEISWVGDFNPKMQSLLTVLTPDFGKRHITYRKLFAEGNIAKRATTIPVDTRDNGKEQEPGN